MAALNSLFGRFSIHMIWGLTSVDWFSLKELKTSWFLVCWVILDLILNILNVV